LLTTL